MPSVPYRIEQTRKRSSRASIAGDHILIRLAAGLSEREREHHVQTLLKRMQRSFIRYTSKTPIDPFRPLINGSTDLLELTFVNGKQCRFELIHSSRNRITKQSGGWRIEAKQDIDQQVLHRALWKMLSASVLPDIERLVAAINASTIRGRINGIKLRFSQSRWGSCSGKGIISVNPALQFTSNEVLRYVILHELVHLKYPNHSKAFWSEVGRWIPEYASHRRHLRTYRLPRISSN